METRTYHCPNCSAPVRVTVGEVEAACHYCDSRLRFIPDEGELAIVRTREEMKYRERVAVEKARLRTQLEQEELARWRTTAGKVAIAALPVVGDVAGRALFGAAVRRGGGCVGCGCLAAVAAAALVASLLAGAL